MGPAARQWSSAILIARRPAARAVRAVSAATSRASASSSSSSASSPSSSAASGSSGARLISVPASHRPARSAALVYGRVEATVSTCRAKCVAYDARREELDVKL